MGHRQVVVIFRVILSYLSKEMVLRNGLLGKNVNATFLTQLDKTPYFTTMTIVKLAEIEGMIHDRNNKVSSVL